VILECDPAVIDGYGPYFDSDYDESKITLDGEPARWLLKPLCRSQKEAVGSYADKAGQTIGNSEAIRYALESVSNFFVADDDSEFKIKRKGSRLEEQITRGCWLELNLTKEIADELAQHIARISNPDPTL
jgi:hypothetical protein